MSFREKSAWIALAAYGGVFSVYFFLLWQGWDSRYSHGLSVGLMFAAVVALVAIAAGLTILAAVLSPKEANAPADERERAIELKSERLASYVLSVGVVMMIGALLLQWNGVLVANLLLAAMVISELAKALAQIAYFRAGA